MQRLGIARQLCGECFARRWSGEWRLARHELVGEEPDRVDVDAVVGVASPASCSGAMYAGVPMAIPADVMPVIGIAALRALATPKSVTSACDPCVRMFAGLMSRWMTPRSCANASASTTSCRIRIDFAGAELLLPLERGAQRFPLDVRHRVPQQIALLSGGEERHDMWMLKLRGDLDLSAEAVAIDAGGQLGWQHLHDDVAAEHAVDGHEDAAHAATRQLTIELIVGSQRFCRWSANSVIVRIKES